MATKNGGSEKDKTQSNLTLTIDLSSIEQHIFDDEGQYLGSESLEEMIVRMVIRSGRDELFNRIRKHYDDAIEKEVIRIKTNHKELVEPIIDAKLADLLLDGPIKVSTGWNKFDEYETFEDFLKEQIRERLMIITGRDTKFDEYLKNHTGTLVADAVTRFMKDFDKDLTKTIESTIDNIVTSNINELIAARVSKVLEVDSLVAQLKTMAKLPPANNDDLNLPALS